jgi:hypothetical protein
MVLLGLTLNPLLINPHSDRELCHPPPNPELCRTHHHCRYPSNAQAVMDNFDGTAAQKTVSYTAIGADQCAGHADCGVPCLSVLITDLDQERKNAGALFTKNQMWAAVGIGSSLAAVVAGVVVWRSRGGARGWREEYEMIA